MQWFRNEVSFARHRKNRRLAKILDIPLWGARGLVNGLFCTVCGESPDGSIADWDDVDIAYACDWEGDPGELAAALRAVRFIVNLGNGDEINDWSKYAQTDTNAARQRRFRERRKAEAAAKAEAAKAEAAKIDDTSAARNVTRNVTVTLPVTPTDRQTDRQTNIHTSRMPDSVTRSGNFLPDLTPTEPPPTGPEAANPKVTRDDVNEVWQHYRRHHPKATRELGAKRPERRLIRDRLKDYGVDDIKAAIDGFHADPFYNGKETGKSYLGLRTLLRDSAQVQKGLELQETKEPGGRETINALDHPLLAGDTEH